MGNPKSKPASSQPQNWETRTTPPDNEDLEKLKLNGSVYELRTGGENPEVEVIFFHGLQPPNSYDGAYWKTWLSRDGTVVWPQKWLGEYLPKARILSIAFDSAVLAGTRNHTDLRQITENLVRDIVLKCAAGQRCPVLLVGHSLGGIIIKQFILFLAESIGLLDSADKDTLSGVAEMKEFLENCKGVFYYSSPQAGTNLADYLDRWPVNTHIVDLLRVLGKETARINDEFSRTRKTYDIKTGAIFELHDTCYLNFNKMVVPEGSNRIDLDYTPYTTETNHFEVCKPKNHVTDNTFTMLVDFIENRASATLPEKRSITVKPLRRQTSDGLC